MYFVVIYAFLGVNFILQKLCQCKKNDNYQVCHRSAQTAYCALVAGVVETKICIRGFWTILQKEKRRSGKAKKEKHNLSNQRPMLLNKEVTSKTKLE